MCFLWVGQLGGIDFNGMQAPKWHQCFLMVFCWTTSSFVVLGGTCIDMKPALRALCLTEVIHYPFSLGNNRKIIEIIENNRIIIIE